MKPTIVTVSSVYNEQGEQIHSFTGKVESLETVTAGDIFPGIVTTMEQVLTQAHTEFCPTEEEKAARNGKN
jgi:hypothetical protein